MSFPKAKVKRFNEVEGDGGPPVGAYDPKLVEKNISASFLKSMRFKNSDQDLSNAADSSVFSVDSSARKIPQSSSCSSFKMPPRTRSFSSATQSGKVQECEKEIKRLLNERSSLLKQLAVKEEEYRKLDGKLQASLREKTTLKASLASFERENKELRRMSEILTMKVNTMGSIDRKKDLSAELLSLNEQLMRKGHEVHDLRIELTQVRRELEEALVAVGVKNDELDRLQMSVADKVRDAESQLETTRSELHELQLSHQDLADSSEAMHDQMHKLVETIGQNEALVAELQKQKSELLSELVLCQKELESKETASAEVTDALRRENLTLLSRVEDTAGARQRDTRLMAVQLDNAQQKLQSTEECSRALQEYRDALVDRVATLKETIAELEDQQMSDLNTIKNMKVEILNLSSQLSAKEKALTGANSEITSLKEDIHELQKLKLQVIQLSAKSCSLESLLEECSGEKETLQGELIVRNLALQAAEQEATESKSELDDAKTQLRQKKELAECLETELIELQSSTSKRETELKTNLELLEADCKTKQTQMTSLSTKLDTKIVEKQFLKVKLQTEKEELEHKLKSQSEICASLEQVATALRRTNKELGEHFVDMASKYELDTTEMEVIIECMWGEILALRIELEVCQEELTRAEEEKAAVEAEFLYAKEEVAAKEEESAAAAMLVYEKMQLVSQLMASVDTLEANEQRLKEFIAVHVMEIEQLSSDVLTQEAEIKIHLAKCLSFETQLKMRHDELEQLKGDHVALNTNLRDTTTELKVKSNENVGLQATVAELRRDVSDLHCTLKAQSTALLQTRSELKISNNRLENKSGEISELQLEKRGLEERVDALTDDLCIANKSMENEIAARIELNGIVEAKKKEIAGLQDLVHEGEVHIARLERNEIELMESKRLTDDQLSAQKLELEAVLRNLQESREDNERQLVTLRNEMRLIDTAKNDAEMMSLDTKNMRNLLHGELRKTQRELQEAETKVASGEKTAQELSELIGVLQKSEDELLSVRQRTKELEETVLTQKVDVERLKVEAASKRTALQNAEEEVSRMALIVTEKDDEIAELRVVVENNQQLMFDKSLFEDLTEHLKVLSEKNQKQEEIVEELRRRYTTSDETVEQQKRDIQRHAANMEWYKDREKDLLKELEMSEEKFKEEEQILKKTINDTLWKVTVMEAQHQAYREQKENEGQQNEELLQSLTNEYEKKLKTIQEKDWKQMYEELQMKVEPFMEQLNAYEIERKVLLSKNRETKSDLEKLSDQYATLLGHQNHRQKIHHVTKLKEENLGLKEENTRLWTEVLKLRKIMPRGRELLNTPAKQRCPPSSSKRPSDKENASPLRDRNVL